MALSELDRAYPLFDWAASNGAASGEQTRTACWALGNQGECIRFSYLVWNDMVDALLGLLRALGVEAEAGGMRMSETDKALTAARFNAFRKNLEAVWRPGWPWAMEEKPEWLSYPAASFLGRADMAGAAQAGEDADVVYGWYLLELVRKLNILTRVLRGDDVAAELAYGAAMKTLKCAGALAARACAVGSEEACRSGAAEFIQAAGAVYAALCEDSAAMPRGGVFPAGIQRAAARNSSGTAGDAGVLVFPKGNLLKLGISEENRGVEAAFGVASPAVPAKIEACSASAGGGMLGHSEQNALEGRGASLSRGESGIRAVETGGCNADDGGRSKGAAFMERAWAVRFCDHQGALLHQEVVLDGENCPDPVATGAIAEPARESDARYHYTAFTGWTRTPHGDAEAGALDGIAAPAVFYPAFQKELRYYDISFYDGASLLATLSVAYGDTPSYTPEKSGYLFLGWTPELAPVTGDASYGAIWMADCLASGTCGENALWVLSKTGELVISGTGDMADFASASAQPWYAYASEIKTLKIEDGITAIGARAFRGCGNLVSAEIADSVTSIGDYAFYGCTGLHSINPQYSFIKEVRLPENVVYIGFYAFHGCTAITTVIIPDSVVTVNYRAFQNCAALKSVTVGAGVTTIGDHTFYGCSSLSSAKFRDVWTWTVYSSSTATSGTTLSNMYALTDSGRADWLKNTYVSKWWRKT